MLGASGVQMGTHFVVTDESQVHENYKDRIIKAKDIDSRVTGRTTGHPVRALRNEMTRKYLELENQGASFEELEKLFLTNVCWNASNKQTRTLRLFVRTRLRRAYIYNSAYD